MQRSFIWLFVLIFVCVVGIPLVTSADEFTLSGWGWSSNTGWVKFSNDGSNWNVVIDKGTGYFQGRDGGPGYAWSNHVGWVKFDASLDGPDGGPEPRDGVRLIPPDGGEGSKVLGWARACSVAVDCNFNNLKPDSEHGGWDGWLWFGSDYGGGGGGGRDGFWWFDERDDDWRWNIFECNDEEENDPIPDGIDEGDPHCYDDWGVYHYWWDEDGWGNSTGWFKNLINTAFAAHGGSHRIAGFGWGADVLGWLFVDLEVDGDEEPPPPNVELKAGVTDSGNWVAGRLTVDEGTPVSLQWTTENVGDQGGRCTGDWGTNGDKDPDGDEEDLGILPPQQNPYVYTIDCQNNRNEHDRSSVEVVVEGGDDIIVTLYADDGGELRDDLLTTDTQTPVTLSWQITNGPADNDCTASWDNDLSIRDDGSDPIGLLEAGSYNYTLECEKDGVRDLDGVTVEVNEPGDDPCETNGLRIMGDGVIEITSQPLDREVLSSFERIQNTCSEAIDVAVKDILSMVYDRGQGGNGSLIDVGQLRDTDPSDGHELTGSGNQKLPKCLLRLGNEEPRDCRSWDGTNFSIGPDEIATFGIEIWRPIRTIKDNQPYQVRLGDRCLGGGEDCNPDAAGRNVRLRFEYRVGNVIDE